MKKAVFFLIMISLGAVLFAQQRHALVIGNNNYTSIQRLSNPVNDATDIAAKLRTLGYQVDLQTNVTNVAMARAVTDFINRLSQNRDNEGFFWFAGHGVQINGENYLLPIDVNSSNEVEAVHSSYSVRRLIDSLDQVARNKVNVVVLDACRDNPFSNMPGAFRNVSRGLSVIQNMPSDLLVIYSTAPGDAAADGIGQHNSPFAQAFLQGMDSNEDLAIVFRSIARETMRLTNNRQRPFYDGSILSHDHYSLNPQRNQPSAQPTPPAPAVTTPAAPPQRIVTDDLVRINGGTFRMGSPVNEPGRLGDEGPQRQVTVSSFYMGRYPVTQREYQEITGSNPSHFKGDNLPVEMVTWFDAIDYCNALSRREGLTPAYTISGTWNNRTVTWNRNANGYRLPTEAEWEYACRAGTTTAYNTGAVITNNTAWYNANSGGRTHPVGQKPANAWGLYDMHGNVWEWCWDWFGTYPNIAQTNPMGPASGASRVLRGGSWNDSASYNRSVIRGYRTPSHQTNRTGFRVARN